MMLARPLASLGKLAESLRDEGLSPTAERVRARLRKARRVLRPRLVPLDRILQGGENGNSAAQWARMTGDLLRPSRPFSLSPHVQFLEEYRRRGPEVLEPEQFRRTAYFRNGADCIRTVGRYFDCLREEDLVRVARAFAARLDGEPVAPPRPSEFAGAFSARWTLPVVRRIAWSDRFELIDGNHRLAIDWVDGERRAWAWLEEGESVTPLQQLVLDVAWTRGRRELYQPLESPELGDAWRLVRRCDDRFALIKRFLEAEGLLPARGAASLDVACSYGWFVRAFRDLGFDARGVEMDWASVEIGRLAYGLEADRVRRGEVVDMLAREEKRYAVVSCFSLLHHFAMGRSKVGAEELLELLDRVTGKVLFLDTGESHERWLKDSLPEWTPDYVESWLRKHGTFQRVVRLGKDQDAERYPGNYGRTLFACVRDAEALR